jgi:proline iminopeptidase
MFICRILLIPIVLTLFGSAASAQQSAEPEGKFAVVNGHRLWYRIAGQGSPLLLIPGGPGSSHTYYYPSMERLTNSFQVIYFDAFGRGQSERAKNPGEYSLAHDIDDIEGLRKALGLGKIAVYGHSYGGIVAQGYALRYPQSLSKLILANTCHSAEMWQKGSNENWNHEIQNQYPEIWEELQQLRAKGGVSCDPAYQKIQGRVSLSLLYFYDPTKSNISVDTNLDVFCQIAGPDSGFVLGGDLASVDFREQLSGIQVPALILAGRFDRVGIPRYSVQFKTFMPQARFVMFEKSGHMPFLEEPELHDLTVRSFLGK